MAFLYLLLGHDKTNGIGWKSLRGQASLFDQQRLDYTWTDCISIQPRITTLSMKYQKAMTRYKAREICIALNKLSSTRDIDSGK